jgi:hypothetical protein
MKVQLLTIPDCPHADAARQALRAAMTAAGMDAAVEEIDLGRGGAPSAALIARLVQRWRRVEP